MQSRLRALVLLSAVAVAACQEPIATTPDSAPSLAKARAAGTETEVVAVSSSLARLNARLAAAGSNLRIAKAELLVDAKAYSPASATTLIADDRTRGLDAAWVPGDPRRGGRIGVTYAVDPELTTTVPDFPFALPITLGPGGSFQSVPQAELDGHIENAVSAWRNRTCSDAPIERVAVPAGSDPDQLDDLYLGRPHPSPTYLPLADIVQAGWQPPAFFDAVDEDGSTKFLGIAFTLGFVDDQGTPTDINGDGKVDTGLVEIHYNSAFIWTNAGVPNLTDFAWVLTHETGHSLGLGHFGKVFVTKKDAVDGVEITDVKYAPKALMNAVYVAGTGEITGTDNSQFCQLWSSKR